MIDALNRLSIIAQEQSEIIRGFIQNELRLSKDDYLKKEIILDLHAFQNKKPEEIKQLVHDLSTHWNPQRHSLGYRHLEALDLMVRKGESGKRISLPGNMQAVYEYGRIKFSPVQEIVNPAFSYPLSIPGITRIPELNIGVICELMPVDDYRRLGTKKEWVFMDASVLGENPVIRTRQPGDWIRPIGMEGKKSLKKYLIDEKVPRDMRGRIPILTDGQEILWIPGKRISDRVKLTVDTFQVGLFYLEPLKSIEEGSGELDDGDLGRDDGPL